MDTIEAVSFLLENNLNFKVAVTLEDAYNILTEFRHYNEIPANLYGIVKDIKEKIGPISFAGNNPNNGKFDNITFKIGNESSLVIYIQSNLFYRRADKPELHKAILESLGCKYKADEVDVEINVHPMDSQMVTVSARLWWD